MGSAPSPPPGKPPLNYHEPKRLLCTSPAEVPPEVWWPGRLVEVCWASSGPVAAVSVWLHDAAGGAGVAVAPRAPNSGRLVCVLPAALTARLAAARAGAAAPAGGRGQSGTSGWAFKVRVCDAHDPAVEAWSAPVVVVAAQADVRADDLAPKPREQLEFEERVRRRRVEGWRASHAATDAATHAATRRAQAQPHLSASDPAGFDSSSSVGSPGSAGSGRPAAVSVVGALRALRLGEADVLGPLGPAANGAANGLAHLPLHQLYAEVKVCGACYGAYKELDSARRHTESRDAKDAKKHALRQRLVREQVNKTL